MCEFKVRLVDKKEVRDVTDDILFARIENGQILLRNVLGMSETVPNAIIYEMSVPSANLTLISSPILADMINFLEVQKKCYDNNEFDNELIKIWEKLKRNGDEYLQEMRKEIKN